MTEAFLVLNSGSSSIKFQVFQANEELDSLCKGKVTDIYSLPHFVLRNDKGETESSLLPQLNTHEKAISFILDWATHEDKNWKIIAAGHRVVHGGEEFRRPVLVNAEILNKLSELSTLAPMHQKYNLAAIDSLMKTHPAMPQLACFDTAFHWTQDKMYRYYALPQYLINKGMVRYGFHGLSYEWVCHQLTETYPEISKDKVVAAHLGSGCSVCAIQDGKSIASTMGMTALEGLPMSTRCGSLDPGAILFMQQELGMPIAEIEHILYHDSGLKGLSGISGDMRDLAKSPDPKAKFAIDFFCLKVVEAIGLMTIALKGVDAIVFTGGVGENSSFIRMKIMNQLSFLCDVKEIVIPADEERIIALHLQKYL